jgi:hypothetical protein
MAAAPLPAKGDLIATLPRNRLAGSLYRLRNAQTPCTLVISPGQTSTGIVVLSGGTLDVLSGGTVINTVDI